MGFIAQIAFAKDSLSEAVMLAGGHEQLDTGDIQEPKLKSIKSFLETTRITVDLV